VHRPSVTFGFASAPARLPTATRIATPARTATVASGRLGGLPRDRCTLVRHALPKDCQVGYFAHRNPTATAKCRTWTRPTGTPLLVLRWARESRATLSTRRRATAGVPYTALCRRRSSFDGHNAVWGSPGNGLPERRAPAGKQAVETPGGGRDRPRTTNASRHRRAASRSGGATSAERDGRPVERGTEPRGAAAKRGSPERAWRMPGAAEYVAQRVGPGSDRRPPGTAPVGPGAPSSVSGIR
jgi:hypothetical protein